MAQFPALNISEDADNVYVEAELPGLALDDLNVSVTDYVLTIRGLRQPPELEGGTWHSRERFYGEFERSIELHRRVDAGKVTANFINGVLTVLLQKSEAAKPRRIEVSVK